MYKVSVSIAIVLALLIGACSNSEQIPQLSGDKSENRVLASQKQFFSLEIVDRLRDTDFTDFFGEAVLTFRANNLGGVLFKIQPGYLGGGTISSVDRKVGIAVFDSEQAALAAVEARRKNVAAVISPGLKERNGITHWWFSEHQALLSIVQENMVVEVGDLKKRYSEIENELWATAVSFISTAEHHNSPDQLQPAASAAR